MKAAMLDERGVVFNVVEVVQQQACQPDAAFQKSTGPLIGRGTIRSIDPLWTQLTPEC